MNLPDINEVYPQSEEKVHSECAKCGNDIMEGYETIKASQYDFCSWDCYKEQAVEDGTVEVVIAGE